MAYRPIDNRVILTYNVFEVIKLKSYTIELDDDLSTIYEDIAKTNQKSTEQAIQIILKRVIETMLKKHSTDLAEQ